MKLWPFSKQAERITTYQRTDSGVQRVDFTALPAQDQASLSVQPVSPERLRATVEASRGQREQSVARPVARDLSVNPEAMLMGYDPSDKVSLDYIAQVAVVGRVEGFHVLATATPQDLKKAQRKLPAEAAGNTSWAVSAGGHDSWVEDHGEFTERGEVVIPAMLPANSDDIEDWVCRGRRDRYNALAQQGQPRPRQDYTLSGLVNRRQAQEEMVSAGLGTGAPTVKMAVSYVEGGNMLPGRKADGTPYALVGKDSLSVTQWLTKSDYPSAVNQVARDYGYQPQEVVGVEQPGDFHIDMAMALAGPGQVLLNDARQVLELQKGWITEHYARSWFHKDELPGELEKAQKHAERQAVYEDIIAKELTEAGLQVFRVAGCFPATAANEEMNFLNLRQGLNEQGQTFAISLGGEERAEKAFAETLLGKFPCGYQRIHFLDRKLTADSLQWNGGIKCRTKALAVIKDS